MNFPMGGNEVLGFFDFFFVFILNYHQLPGDSDGKESAYNTGDLSLIPGSGRSPGEENGNPLQYSCLENPMAGETGGLQSMGSRRVGTQLSC